jgi:hypothetical protein
MLANQMLDLDRTPIEIACPDCSFYITALFRDIRLNEVLICGGCKANIQLVDYMGTVTKARREAVSAVESLLEGFPRRLKISL